FFQPARASKAHELIKQLPPIGVMGPSHLLPLKLRAYKLPLNKIMPINIKLADKLSKEEGARVAKAAKPSKPKPCINWYKTAVCHTPIKLKPGRAARAWAPNAPAATPVIIINAATIKIDWGCFIGILC